MFSSQGMVTFVLIARLRGIVAWKTYTTHDHAETFYISTVKVDFRCRIRA